MSSHFLSSGISILLPSCHLPPTHPLLPDSPPLYLSCFFPLQQSKVSLCSFIVQLPQKMITVLIFFLFAAVRLYLEWTHFSISILSLPSTSEESECVCIDEKCFSPFHFSFLRFLFTFLLSYRFISQFSYYLLLSFSTLTPSPSPLPHSLEARRPVWRHLPPNMGEGGWQPHPEMYLHLRSAALPAGCHLVQRR